MNKGYAFGFLLILLVLILGFYVAYTGFVSSREALRAQPAPGGGTQVARATRNPTRPAPTITPSPAITPTLAVEVTAALTITNPPGSTAPSQPTDPPPATAPASNPTAPPAQPGGTPPAQPSTPIPAPAHPFRLAGPPSADPDYSICCYIYGTVRDAAGNGLEGVAVQMANEWNPPIVAVTKGGGEIGQYDLPINASVVDWEIALVDAEGNLISTKVQIQFDANAANGYRVDWQRGF